MPSVIEVGLEEGSLLASPLEIRDLGNVFPPISSSSTLDAILIPGEGLETDGEVKECIRACLDAAIEFQDRTQYIIPLSRCTVHKPPVIIDGFPLDESVSGANYLLENGIQPEKIIIEDTSRDTVGNAYHARMIADQLGLRRFLIINPAFRHIRNYVVFGTVFKLPSKRDQKPNYKLHYYNTPNLGFTSNEVNARLSHELDACRKFDELMQGITSLEDFSHYMYTRHEAYRAGGNPKKMGGDALRTF